MCKELSLVAFDLQHSTVQLIWKQKVFRTVLQFGLVKDVWIPFTTKCTVKDHAILLNNFDLVKGDSPQILKKL